MRYVPNSVYPFQKLKFGTRVVFWKILSDFYDSADRRFNEGDSDFEYIPTKFDNVADEKLLTIVIRYMELGYCPAIHISGEPCGGSDIVSGVCCRVDAKWMSEMDDLGLLL